MTSGADWHAIHRVVLPIADIDRRRELYARGGRITSRDEIVCEPGEPVSFATYFGAFPAGYWRAHTGVRRVRLVLTLDAAATVHVRGTDATGRVVTVHTSAAGAGDIAVVADLEGGYAWLWFEVAAQDDAVTVNGARWETDAAIVQPATLTVAITTFDREDDCVRLLDRLGTDAHARSRIDRVVVADQGTRRLSEAPGFAEASRVLGDLLDVVVQPNLGGSGGFSRGMLAAVGTSSHVLVLDDDVDLEPESLARVAAFAERAPRPVIVGAQMLSLVEPTILHSFGERVDRTTMWWTPVEPALSSLDLATARLNETPALSTRIDVDFNGWWMCLIPSELVAAAGASLPLFIKWDDAEFGLRASGRGVPTVTLPGAALWHMPWTAKDDGLDWQAYFQLRNRLVTALIHGGPGVLRASFPQDVNHALCAQYGSIALRNLALRDVLSGPSHLDAVLAAGPRRPAGVLRERGQVIVPEAEAPSGVRLGRPSRPEGRLAQVGRVLRVLARQLRRTDAAAPAVRLARVEAKWWSLGLLDSAVVEAAGGGGVFVVRRDRTAMVGDLREAILLRWKLARSWRHLARDYRDASADVASAEAWERRFAADAPACEGTGASA